MIGGVILTMVFPIGIISFFIFGDILFTDRQVIQSIKYGDKKIEVYILDHGSLATPTTNIGMFSWYEKKYRQGNIFSAPQNSQRINIKLKTAETPPILEVYHFLLKNEIYKREENINGIKVVYREVNEKYEFIGY